MHVSGVNGVINSKTLREKVELSSCVETFIVNKFMNLIKEFYRETRIDGQLDSKEEHIQIMKDMLFGTLIIILDFLEDRGFKRKEDCNLLVQLITDDNLYCFTSPKLILIECGCFLGATRIETTNNELFSLQYRTDDCQGYESVVVNYHDFISFYPIIMPLTNDPNDRNYTQPVVVDVLSCKKNEPIQYKDAYVKRHAVLTLGQSLTFKISPQAEHFPSEHTCMPFEEEEIIEMNNTDQQSIQKLTESQCNTLLFSPPLSLDSCRRDNPEFSQTSCSIS